MEKEQTAADLWFGPDPDKEANVPGRPRAPGSLARGQGPKRLSPGSEGDDRSSELKFGKNSASKDGEQMIKGHTSKELNLRNLLAPDHADISLNGLLGSGPVAANPSEDRTRRRDDFGLHRSLSRNRPNGKLGIINIRLEA